MATQIPYTSTLPAALLRWISQFASEHGKTKKDVIVSALESYRYKQEQQQMIAGFQAIANDAELMELADAGLSDTLDQFQSLDL